MANLSIGAGSGYAFPSAAAAAAYTVADFAPGTIIAGASYDDGASTWGTSSTIAGSGTHGNLDAGRDAGGCAVELGAPFTWTDYLGLFVVLEFDALPEPPSGYAGISVALVDSTTLATMVGYTGGVEANPSGAGLRRVRVNNVGTGYSNGSNVGSPIENSRAEFFFPFGSTSAFGIIAALDGPGTDDSRADDGGGPTSMTNAYLFVGPTRANLGDAVTYTSVVVSYQFLVAP